MCVHVCVCAHRGLVPGGALRQCTWQGAAAAASQASSRRCVCLQASERLRCAASSRPSATAVPTVSGHRHRGAAHHVCRLCAMCPACLPAAAEAPKTGAVCGGCLLPPLVFGVWWLVCACRAWERNHHDARPGGPYHRGWVPQGAYPPAQLHHEFYRGLCSDLWFSARPGCCSSGCCQAAQSRCSQRCWCTSARGRCQ